MSEPGRLARRLGLGDAVVIGLGAMLGAGVFAAPAPAAAAAGSWLLLGLGLAALVAYANARASARLAAIHPEAGGTYVYARERLGPVWGFLAGWCFVVGKTASLAAMALTFGTYAHEPLARPLGMAAVLVLALVNAAGVEKTARLTRVIVVLVLLTLGLVLVTGLGAPPAAWGREPMDPRGVLQSAGLLFFAFAGYARLATLGEEVREPERTIPRAIGLALGAVVLLYAAVLGVALSALGADGLARHAAPLAAVVEAGGRPGLVPAVRLGATVAAAGVLLSLLAGVSRTTLAMARRGELPRTLAAVHARRRTPVRAELTAAALVCLVVAVADLRGAIGFSSFAVLLYYALTNASAWTLQASPRARALPLVGLVGCVTLALSLPVASVVGGIAPLTAGGAWWLLLRRRQAA